MYKNNISFSEHQLVRYNPELDSACLEIAQAFDRLTYKSIYIFDYVQKKFEYVSNHRFFLQSCTSEKIMEMGEQFFLTYIKPEDQPVVTQANEAGLPSTLHCQKPNVKITPWPIIFI